MALDDCFADLFHGFSDRSRLAIVAALRDGEQRVSDLVAATGLSQPNASMHLACLWECGLVAREKRGREVYYRLIDGVAERPAGWVAANLFPQRVDETLVWTHPVGQPAELQITSSGGDTAEWSQTLSLAPGWYHLSGELLTEGIQRGSMPPVLGIRVRGHAYGWTPADTTTWQQGDFYFRTGAPQTEVTVACQFGPPGTAHFRHLRLTQEAGAPPTQARQVDLEKEGTKVARLDRRFSKPKLRRPYGPPVGSAWTVFALFGFLIAISAWGWLALGEAQKS